MVVLHCTLYPVVPIFGVSVHLFRRREQKERKIKGEREIERGRKKIAQRRQSKFGSLPRTKERKKRLHWKTKQPGHYHYREREQYSVLEFGGQLMMMMTTTTTTTTAMMAATELITSGLSPPVQLMCTDSDRLSVCTSLGQSVNEQQ